MTDVYASDEADVIGERNALREKNLKFSSLVDAIPHMVWSTMPDGYHDYYNAKWYEFTGMPEGSTDGEAWNGMSIPTTRSARGVCGATA